MKQRRDISFGENLVQMFPDESDHKPLTIGGNFTRELTLQVTEDCNMACTYCYQHNKTPKKLSYETGKKFFDLILASDERTATYMQSRNSIGCIIEFIGGEPLLEIDLMDALTDYFISECIRLDHRWATRYRISVGTNGLLYFDDKVQRYIEKNFGMLSFSITVDGNKMIHDMCRFDKAGNPTYDRALAASQDWFKRIGATGGITKITLSPQNIELACDAVTSMLQHDYDAIHINCVYEEGWELDHAKILYEKLKGITKFIIEHPEYASANISILDNLCGTPDKHIRHDGTWCGGLGLMTCLAPDGYIYPCLRYAPSSNAPGATLVRIGHVDHGIGITPEERYNIKAMSKVSYITQYSGTECENCQISTGCGNCPGYGFECTGKIGARTTYHCIMHKARSLATFYHKYMKWKHLHLGEPIKLYCPEEWAVPIIGEDEYRMLVEMSKEVDEYVSYHTRQNSTAEAKSKE